MIRLQVNKLNGWFNRMGKHRKLNILVLFCATFLLLLWMGIRYYGLNTQGYVDKAITNIGRPSGELRKDSTTLKK